MHRNRVTVVQSSTLVNEMKAELKRPKIPLDLLRTPGTGSAEVPAARNASVAV
jgi:hypothetical protein